ncbi:MAG: hypothetical protein NT091_01960, partial [Candidatus Falkowbacteria bacterium]|nr:hypothetical protein [Candidatus Falkowbacteria bacterium]
DQTALTSIDVRTTCELSAIDKTTAQDQSDANQLCIDTDQKIKNDNESTFEKARETVQKTFQTDVKNCISTPLDTNASSSVNVIK